MPSRRRSKVWLLIPFWLVQASAVYLLPALFVERDPTNILTNPADVVDTLAEPDYVLFALATLVGITLCQALIVLPVLPAKLDRHARPSWARCLIAGSALGLIGATLFYLVLAGGEAARLWRVPDVLANPIAPPFVSLAVTLSLIASAIIRRACARGIPIMLSLTMLALIAAMILTGAAFALAELFEQLTTFELPTAGWVTLTALAVLVPWTLGTLLIRAYLRRGAPTQTEEWALTRIARWLFWGSAIEIVAAIPLDVMVRRRTSCYCSEGTFWTLVLAATAGLAALGPMVFFLPLARRRQRAFQGLCPSCGYDRRSLAPDAPCPECGQSPLGSVGPSRSAL
ncbi:MAG: hypothetical protein SFY95_05665 [Planctomycetota bacterium]|nr:hypothetical protein [Planctomycetota bacterium]